MEMEQEVWRPIKDFDMYEVSNLGRVRNAKTGKILKPIEDVWGYLNVGLYNDNNPTRFYKGKVTKSPKKKKIHQLVAEAFCDGYQEGFVPDHIDFDTRNNRADNLRWISRSENKKHSRAWANRKLNRYIEPVKLITKDGEVQQFASIVDAGQKTGLEPRSIAKQICGRREDFKIGHFELVNSENFQQINLTV